LFCFLCGNKALKSRFKLWMKQSWEEQEVRTWHDLECKATLEMMEITRCQPLPDRVRHIVRFRWSSERCTREHLVQLGKWMKECADDEISGIFEALFKTAMFDVEENWTEI